MEYCKGDRSGEHCEENRSRETSVEYIKRIGQREECGVL